MDAAIPPAATPILVTGGSGTLGRLVVARLRSAGQAVRVLSRGRRAHETLRGVEYMTGDLTTGAGVEAAVAGISIIVHCAGTAKGDEVKTRRLVEAASRAGAKHLVYISVVGADRVPAPSRIDRLMFGYFVSKLASERIVAESGLPWTTLRATQFHEAMLLTARQMARSPVLPAMAGFRFQPVAVDDQSMEKMAKALGCPVEKLMVEPYPS